jgi:CDP-paratose 2-epimerase
MSCIYGPHQCGNEDQGWVAHFLVQAMAGRDITIFGDGRQVRDALFVDDLVDAMDIVVNNATALSGRAFNMGGGTRNTISLLELLDMIEDLEGRAPNVSFGDWRIGDQRWYVSDTSAFERETGWAARVGVRAGVEQLHRWLREHRSVTSLADAS